MERRELIVKFPVGGRNIVFDVRSKKDAELLSHILKSLYTEKPEPSKPVARYEEGFKEYLLRDRGIEEQTARSYVNYLRKLDGQVLDYGLYLKISSNKWMVKTVRLYVDYLEKTERISEEDAERLKKIFRVKNKTAELKPYVVDAERLVKVIHALKPGVYRTILLLLFYSGARLSEVVKMLKTFSEDRLTCLDSFCRYFLGWRRGRKRCDYIYFPKFLLDDIARARGRVGTYDTVRDNLFDEYGVRTKDYRKLFYRICKDEEVPREVCDFYQSRITKLNIGDVHYDDLLSRADKHYPKLIKKLAELLENPSRYEQAGGRQ